MDVAVSVAVIAIGMEEVVESSLLIKVIAVTGHYNCSSSNSGTALVAVAVAVVVIKVAVVPGAEEVLTTL